MNLLALIPARGGSKGVPRKNIKSLHGKPLIGWSIDAAKKSRFIDKVVVSTEDDEIAAIARDLGAEIPFMRPIELAADDTPGIAPVMHAIENLPEFDWVILLQPTSPLRTAEDIDEIVRFCIEHDAPSAVSVYEVDKHPYLMYQRDETERLQPLLADKPDITRRQDLPPVYALNGALYLARIDWLKERQSLIGQETLGYVMSPESSADIDTPLDWQWVEFLIEQGYAK